MSTDRKWSISTDGEHYSGQYDTLEQAVQEGTCLYGRFWSGQCITPIPPEKLFDADIIAYWIEQVSEHDDYAGEWAEWIAMEANRKELNELAEQLRPLVAAWLDRHEMRPTHWNIDPMTVRLCGGNEVHDVQ